MVRSCHAFAFAIFCLFFYPSIGGSRDVNFSATPRTRRKPRRVFSWEKDSMTHQTDDLRIKEIKELSPPTHLLREFPVSEKAANTVFASRQALHRILHGMDDRLMVVVGPCSIHDTSAALEYTNKLLEVKNRLKNDIEIVMRVYFEKPRTTVGWKGLINDPKLDGSFDINNGLRVARELLLNINEHGMPAATEYLDTISPQYIADLIAWGAIGARTTESQVHRELASGLSCPVGFKNGTDGNIKIAVDAIKASSQPHYFLSVTKGGHSAIVSTSGNEDCHVILRGGKQPNFDAPSVEAASAEIAKAGLAARLMIDCSHGNSSKKHENQIPVAADIGSQVANGDTRIVGIMLESHLKAGRQDLIPNQPLEYGVSITDACIGWEETVEVLEGLARNVQSRRIRQAVAAK
jgi:3-deoxy-7-phosphoheptulonate synthase